MDLPIGTGRTARTAGVAGVLLCALLAISGCTTVEETLPSFHRWGRIELIFEGPAMKGLGDPNPFEIPFDVMFTGPDGSTSLVPGFYDGDGQGGVDGNIWKVRFSADQNGVWRWHTQSTEPTLSGLSGRIGVVDPPVDAPDLFRLGRLEYTGERYLKFREGGYWIKSGADEPENLLGNAFGARDWEAKKAQIDYLASTGVNSVYVMTHNLGGDGRDVWPWYGDTADEAKKNLHRFDPAKLDRWLDLFEHIQSRGIVLHIVLEDDSAWTGYDYTLYYREMVARFGFLPALYFNFCEEYNERHTLEDALGYMELLSTIDPYNHPRAIHNVNLPRAAFVDSPAVQVTSIQTDPSKPATLNSLAGEWFSAPLARQKRPLVVSFDEARPAGDRRSWWAVYLGGGIWESLLEVPNGYREFDRQWRELALARSFLEPLPVERMFPANYLVTEGQAFCLALPGEFYALYLPYGGTGEVQLVEGNRYRVSWFNPRAVDQDPWAREGIEIEGGAYRFDALGKDDWALKIERIEGEASGPPNAPSAWLWSARNEPVSIHLARLPAETPGDFSYEILTPPKAGALTGTAPDLIYTPRPGFTGEDRFRWRVSSEAGRSNTAAVRILCTATGENMPPRAYNQSVRGRAGEPLTFILRYADRDGPGPYRIRITAPPEHGTITGLDNDITYTPEVGFTGRDSLRWLVTDGAGRSSEAKVEMLIR